MTSLVRNLLILGGMCSFGVAPAVPAQAVGGLPPQTSADRLLVDAKTHELRVARIARLRDLYSAREDTEKVRMLDQMLGQETDRY